jgi:hypothetical protein
MNLSPLLSPLGLNFTMHLFWRGLEFIKVKRGIKLM